MKRLAKEMQPSISPTYVWLCANGRSHRNGRLHPQKTYIYSTADA